MPKVSVILTSYNHEKYICEAIESVLNQTFTDFELIILDDGSTDNSWNIINQYTDPRIKAFRSEEQGEVVYHLNNAISNLASGGYIAIHHSDDSWEFDKLEKQVASLDSNLNIGAVFTWVQVINEHGDRLTGDWFDQKNKTRWQWLNQLFLGENHLNHPSVLIRKQCYKNVGLFRYGLLQTGDAEMWSRILLKFDIHVIPEKLTKHRIFSDGKNTSGVGLDKSIRTENEWNVIRTNLFESASCEDIFKIFPGLEKYYRPTGCVAKFLMSIACLYECRSRAAWTLGLNSLYELVRTPAAADQIKALYQFDYHELIKLSGQFDPFAFGISEGYEKIISDFRTQVAVRDEQIGSLNQQIGSLNQQIGSLNQQIGSLNQQISAILRSSSWRMTKGFRWTRRVLSQGRQKLQTLTLSRIGRYVYHKLPISLAAKIRVKHAVYRFAGRWFKNSSSYRQWYAFHQLRQAPLDCRHEVGATHTSPIPHELQVGAKKILVIDDRTPTPDRDAASVTAWFFLKAFVELKYDVTFIPDNLFPLGRYTENLRSLGVRVLTNNEIGSVEEFLAKSGGQLDFVFLYRVHTARLSLPLVKKYAPQAKIVFDTVDLHYLREQRQAELSKVEESIKAAQYTKHAEFEMMRAADATIVLSQAEQQIVKREDPSINVFNIPLLLDIPGCKAPFTNRRDIVFIGGFLHQPNIDAVKYFVDEIWPSVRAKLPDANLLIIGSDAPDDICALGELDERIKVIGYVENLDSYFNQCRLSIAPLRYGAGIKGKIGTSASYGVPCIATNLAAEGMGLADGVEVLVADGAEQFAEKLIDLYNNEDLWGRISRGSLDFVQRNYSYIAGKAHLQRLLNSLTGGVIEKNMLDVTAIKSLQEFIKYRERRKNEYARRVAIEKASVGDPRGFTLEGYCAVCKKPTTFHADFEYAFTDVNGHQYPNWRERMICRYCELNNRVRASLHIFEQECSLHQNARIYVTEQTTPLFAWVKKNYSSVVGSEFLGIDRISGEINSAGIRHESLTGLSFSDNSFDFILSFDVFEHIPNYKAAIQECARVLRPGGQMLFSVPFSFDSNEHIVRARLRNDGSVEHLLEPEYHGDPVNVAGCLCFYHFGWRLLDEFKNAGFDSVKALFYWSDKFGYLGFDQALFIATKRS